MAFAYPKNQSGSVLRFSRIAGRLHSIKKTDDYTVNYVRVDNSDQSLNQHWQKILAHGALILSLAFFLILFDPTNWVVFIYKQSPVVVENWIMLACLMLLQVFIIIRTFSATRSTLKAKNPVPVSAAKGLSVAFVTTRAPGEPIEMVEATLKGAKKIKYRSGKVDIWLLDETADPELKIICRRMKVKYFSRNGKPMWNTHKPHRSLKTIFHNIVSDNRIPYPDYDPHFEAKTKHGNFNAWLQYIEKKHLRYDILAGVDTDQVPLPNYLTRILGYFNDPDVAYVVGPQVYGNYRQGLNGLVARWAESQASFFQSTIQRAANSSECAMFVGTNYAVRTNVLYQIGGFEPCITEDMATGLAIHSSKNSITGRNWKSVYTPDILAIGEGPDFWGPYFTQQWRWAAGTFDTLKKTARKRLSKIPLRSRLHYILILSFYPMAALTWLLAIISSSLYLATGASAINAPWGEFFSLYSMAVIMQLSLYFWNRRYNVSPHEEAGSYGVSGMALTALAAPIYFSALIGVALNRKTSFVITKKGSSDNPDWIKTFKIQIGWAALEIAALAYGISHGRDHPALIAWTAVILVPCFLPLVLGMIVALKERHIELTMPESLTQLREEATNA
jgi:cellulose synthase/poly-beta-1,6-N-acetylglucosamine synthase-like glycosyltransferase